MAAKGGDAAPIQVVVIAPADGLQQDWLAGLQSEPGIDVLATTDVLKRGVEAVEQLQPAVVVIDRAVEDIETTLHAIYPVAPLALCIGLLPGQDMAAVRRLVGAGARDVLAKPIQPGELIASLRQVVQLEATRRERVGLPTVVAERPVTQAGKVIVVMGPKGGAGGTTVATNLAVALKQVSGKDVAVADFDLQFGDVAALLNVWSKHTLHDLAIHYQNLDDSLLDRVMVAHTSGVKVLQAPSDPEQAGEVQGAQAAAIVRLLRSRFAYVVVDCWSFLDEITETLMGAADQILLVTTPEVPALKNTKRALQYFKDHGLRNANIAVVVNRFPSVKGVTLKEIEEHLGYPVQANLPSDGPVMTRAANTGTPVVGSHPRSWVGQSFLKLAAWVAGDKKVNTISLAAQMESGAEASAAPQPARRRFSLRRSKS